MSLSSPCAFRTFLLSSCIIMVGCQAPVSDPKNTTSSTSLYDVTYSPDTMKTRRVEFEFSELNWSQVDVSPDGKMILFDALGDLYTMPIDGGQTTLLRDGYQWDMMARFSPDGSQVAFASNQGEHGTFDLWVMPATGGEAEVISSEVYSTLTPEWAWDGASIITQLIPAGNHRGGTMPNGDRGDNKEFKLPAKDKVNNKQHVQRSRFLHDASMGSNISFDRVGEYAYRSNFFKIRRQHLMSGKIETLEIPLKKGGKEQRHFLEQETGQKKTIPLPSRDNEEILSARISPDGKELLYFVRRGTQISLRSLNIDNRKIRTLLDEAQAKPLFDIANINNRRSQRKFSGFSFTPDSKYIIFTGAGKIHKLNIGDGSVNDIPFRATFSQTMPQTVRNTIALDTGPIKIKNTRWPSMDTQGEHLVFGAHGKVWLQDLATKNIRKITSGDGFEFAPVLSPDGSQIAYVDWEDDGSGHVRIIGTEPNAKARTVTINPGHYMNTTWSPDGKKLMVMQAEKAKPGKGRFDRNKRYLKRIDLNNGTEQKILAEVKIINGFITEAQNTPMSFSEDGERLYYMGPNPKGETGYWINSVNLSTMKVTHHSKLVEPNIVDTFKVSPDGKNVAFVQTAHVIVVPMEVLETTKTKDINIGITLGGALRTDWSDIDGVKHIANHRAADIVWNDNETLIWNVSNKIFQTNINNAVDPNTNALRYETLSEIKLEKPRINAEGLIAYHGARLLSMGDDGVIENGIILVRDNKIIDIGPADQVEIPDGANILPLVGKTIMPGMIDTHAHPHGSTSEYFSRQNLPYVGNLSFGVTTLFEVAGAASNLTPAAMVQTGDMLGPRVLGIGHSLTDFSQDLTTDKSTYQIVSDLRERGVWGLKSYDIGSQKSRRLLLEAARIYGISVVTHDRQHPWSPLIAAAEGHTAVEHLTTSHPLREDWIKFYAATGTHLTPTLSTLSDSGTIFEHIYKGSFDQENKLSRFVPKPKLKFGHQYGFLNVVNESFGTSTPSSKAAMLGLRNVLRAGGHVSMGLHGEFYGADAHWMLWALVDSGFTPMEALRTVTTEPAHKLGLEATIGSLKKGSMADFIILNSNPLDDIKNSADIEYVVQNGFVYDDESLTQLWPKYKPYSGPFGGDAENYKAQIPDPMIFENP